MQSVLKRRATQLRAEMNSNVQKGITMDTEMEVEARDVEEIRQKLATREERYFEGSFYTTIYDRNEEKLRETSKKFEQKIA
jgi:type IV secretory pathway VirB4 component